MKRIVLASGLLGLACAGSAWSAESPSTATSSIDLDETEEYVNSVDCIELRRIRKTKVLDNSHMLFYMRGEQIYLNQFESRCEQLSDKRKTSFTTALSGRLCRMDELRVLNDLLIREYRGAGRIDFQALSSCYLGAFEPVSEPQAEFLTTETKSGREVRDVLRAYQADDAPTD
ncbi:MAG: hypothetical protein P8Y95_00160 [Gammaproteobacteria bacterium]|jgi:hypothetical protein